MKAGLFLALFVCLAGSAVADGGNPCPDAYTEHVFPTRELTLLSVTLNGKALDSASAAAFAIALPQNYPASHQVHPFLIFKRTDLAEEDAGPQDSVTAFWLPDSILSERIRFIKQP